MKALHVHSPGGYTTVQDRGRFGYQHEGVPVSGALDKFAYTVANFLVENTEEAPVLEITVAGPILEVIQDMDIALTGADMGMTVNDKPVEQWESIRVKKGDIITIGQIKSGCRSYLAVSGGIKVPQIMGSSSTYVGGKIGGFGGRPLLKGDILQNNQIELQSKHQKLESNLIPEYPSKTFIRAIVGPQDDYFEDGFSSLFGSEFMVTAKADRMGYRLQGPNVRIREDMPKSIISEPCIPGSIQIPANEQPIILLVEQTVGGYAKIATIISSDLSKVAQATPGDIIIFKKIDLEASHMVYFEEQKKLNDIKKMLCG